MKIFGIGVDIVKNDRFKKLLKKKILSIEFLVKKNQTSLKIKKIKYYIYQKDFPQKKHLSNHQVLVLDIIYVLQIFQF